MDNATLTRLALTSDAFKDGQPIPRVYSCDGANDSPAIYWSDPPAGTKSFALVIDDPDAPRGTFRHWGVYDIPASPAASPTASISAPKSTTTAASPAIRAPARPGATASTTIISSCSPSASTGST